MRVCRNCKCNMIKGFDAKVEGGAYGIKISQGEGIFAKRLEKPKVAICPKCGEISFYIDNINEILQI